jgi:transcriptional regulator with XRE-family HTH domain
MSNIYERFGSIIRKYRKIQKYSTQEVATTLNISTGLVSNIENAKNDVFKLELLGNFIKLLNIPTDDLFEIFPATVESIKVDSKTNEIIIHMSHYFNANTHLLINSFERILNSLIDISKEFENEAVVYEVLIPHIINQLETLRLIKKY